MYDPQQAGIAALMNRIDQKKDAKLAGANAAPAPAAKETTDAPRPRASVREPQ